MEHDTGRVAESKYNMNESNFALLGELQREAFHFLNVRKDFVSCMDRWRSIRYIIESVFSEPEAESLDTIEKNFGKNLKFNVPGNLSSSKPMYGISPKQIFINRVIQKYRLEHLRNYIRELAKLMRKYKISMTDLDKKKKLG